MASFSLLGFNKKESFGIFVILTVIFLVTCLNLLVSVRKRRDAQRKGDVRAITDALKAYQADFAFFPPSSSSGKIMACSPQVDDAETIKDEIGNPILGPCDWGWDSLRDISDPTYPAYLERLPTDPHHRRGVRYFYISTGSHYQLFAALEGEDEAEYDEAIVKRNILCGTRVCNYGLSYADTPLDKSLEEYENEIRKEFEN